MKTAVDRIKKGKGRVVNARFAVMCGHYLFDADFCNVASGWEKGTGWPRAMPAPFDGYVEKPAQVSSTCLVNGQCNRYCVPCELAGHMVSTRLYPNRVSVVAGDVVVASHDRLVDRGQTCYDWPHYIPLVARKPGALRNGAPFMDLPKPLHRLRQGLLRYEGVTGLWRKCWPRPYPLPGWAR